MKEIEKAAEEYLHKVADGLRPTGYCDEDFTEGAKWFSENQTDYLNGFINQFDPNSELCECSDDDWSVSGFLKWLENNEFKIVKKIKK